MIECAENLQLPLLSIPLGEIIAGPPAPNAFEADYSEYKDIKSLMERDQNAAATITAVAQGMRLAGVTDSGKSTTRELLVAVQQIGNDIRRQQEECVAQRSKVEKDKLKTENNKTLDKKAAEEPETSESPFAIFFEGGKSPFTNLKEVIDEGLEKSNIMKFPGFSSTDVSTSELGTGTPSPGTMAYNFKSDAMGLAA